VSDAGSERCETLERPFLGEFMPCRGIRGETSEGRPAGLSPTLLPGRIVPPAGLESERRPRAVINSGRGEAIPIRIAADPIGTRPSMPQVVHRQSNSVIF
jgi:hypothetical protein